MEIWKNIPGYEGEYLSSDLGNIKSLKRRYLSGEKILSGSCHTKGYRCVVLSKNGEQKQYKVHRLVALSFIENFKNKREVNHINGIKSDNRVENLEWVTSSENQKHAYKTGLKIITEKMKLALSEYNNNRNK